MLSQLFHPKFVPAKLENDVMPQGTNLRRLRLGAILLDNQQYDTFQEARDDFCVVVLVSYHTVG